MNRKLTATNIIALFLVIALIGFGIVLALTQGSVEQIATTRFGFKGFSVTTGNIFLAFGFLLVIIFALNQRASHSVGSKNINHGTHADAIMNLKSAYAYSVQTTANKINIFLKMTLNIVTIVTLILGGYITYKQYANNNNSDSTADTKKWIMKNSDNRSFQIFRLYGGTTTRDYDVCFNKKTNTSDSVITLYDGVGLNKNLPITEKCAEVRATNYLIIERKTNNGEVSGTYRRLE